MVHLWPQAGRADWNVRREIGRTAIFRHMEWQQRSHRAAAFTCDHLAEAARSRKGEADGAMNLEGRGDVHGRAPMREAAGARSWRGGQEAVPRSRLRRHG